VINACSTSRVSAHHLQSVITQLPESARSAWPACHWSFASTKGGLQACQKTSAAGHKLAKQGCSAPAPRAAAAPGSGPARQLPLVAAHGSGHGLRAPHSAGHQPAARRGWPRSHGPRGALPGAGAGAGSSLRAPGAVPDLCGPGSSASLGRAGARARPAAEAP